MRRTWPEGPANSRTGEAAAVTIGYPGGVPYQFVADPAREDRAILPEDLETGQVSWASTNNMPDRVASPLVPGDADSGRYKITQMLASLQNARHNSVEVRAFHQGSLVCRDV